MKYSKTTRRALRLLSTYALWIVASVITLIPIYWMFVISARSRVELFDRPSFIIHSFFEENYINVINNETFRGYMVNSIIISTANAILVAVLALLATYALSRWRLAGADNIFFWTITIGWLRLLCSCCLCIYSLQALSRWGIGDFMIPASA